MKTKPEITIEDLDRIDIRVGTIVDVKDIEESRSLVQLIVDFGDEQRTVLAGMKGEREDPTEIIGLQTLFVVNLQPREMMGRLSQGMLFDVGYADGIMPVLAITERTVPNGTRAG